jgi:GT2 family glycosyltransferase
MKTNRLSDYDKSGITVVVPTHGRVGLINNLLISLQEACNAISGKVEIVIIDSSEQEDSKKIESLCEQYEAKYIKGSINVREKRNFGIREAGGEIILFVDSDCEVTERLFEEHLKMYDEPDTAGVLGVTEFVGKETTTWKIVQRTKFLDAFSFAKTLASYVKSAPWGTCTNLSLKKEILEKVRGFDTNFPFRLGGDDTDLGIRINKAGYKIKMNPNAIVYHTKETWNKFPAVAKRVFRWGRTDYYVFYRKHRDKLSSAFPKPIAIFTFLLIFSFIKGCMSNLLLYLSLPFIWLLLFLFLNAFLKIVSSKDSLKNIHLEMLAQFLHFLFDFGTIFESIKNQSILVFFKTPLDDPRQVIVLWNEKVWEVWSTIFSTFLILLILLVV